MFSNLNSYPRESLDGMTPYDKFVAEYGQEGCKFLDALGIERIPAAQVTLHPFLLGQNFQRAADKAILRKNGVTDKQLYFFNTENCLIFASAEGDDSERMRGCGGERE